MYHISSELKFIHVRIYAYIVYLKYLSIYAINAYSYRL